MILGEQDSIKYFNKQKGRH